MKPKILFKISGSIAAYKACYLISKLVQNNFEVQVVASMAALEFVGEATLEGLTGSPIHKSLFSSGHYMQHIHLDRWADLVVLCPATANTINKLANGISDDLIGALFLAHDRSKPYLIAPAMNVQMYQHPITQKSLKALAEIGCTVFETESGVLACGDLGSGKLVNPDVIYSKIAELTSTLWSQSVSSQIQNNSTKNINSTKLRVLITTGGTKEPIDAVRSITNTSTGKTGWHIAQYFSELGFDVTCLSAKGSKPALMSSEIQNIEFETFKDLEGLLNNTLKKQKFDILIHAAAVSDFSMEPSRLMTKSSKMASGKPVTLKLVPNPKLVNKVKRISKNKSLRLVAFKLTRNLKENAVLKKVQLLAKDSNCDLVLQNELSEITESKHRFNVYKNGKKIKTLNTKNEMAGFLVEWASDLAWSKR